MRQFIVLALAALIAPVMHAEAPCPANIKAIPFRNANHHQMVVGVSINHSGPYDFLLDTGSQMTIVDRSLAVELHLPTTGNANVAGVSVQGGALYAHLDAIEVGDHVSMNQGVLVYNMKPLQAAGFAISGALGQDYLSRFDVLIDNAHGLLCLDDTGALLGSARGASAPPVPSRVEWRQLLARDWGVALRAFELHPKLVSHNPTTVGVRVETFDIRQPLGRLHPGYLTIFPQFMTSAKVEALLEIGMLYLL